MTLAQIIQLALRQLDEAPEDAGEYDDLFRSYANIGYDIAVREFLRPRERRALYAACGGVIPIEGMGIERVLRVWDARGNERAFELAPDGGHLTLSGPGGEAREDAFTALCEVRYPPLEQDTDEPRLPPSAQAALADYICYRHLSCGNLAKQSRARFFEESFYRAMRGMRPQGYGSVTRARHLYEVTDARYRE